MTATARPSGKTAVATAATMLVWPVNGGPTGVPVVRSHTRTVASHEPVTATARPSGKTAVATAATLPVWPVNGGPTAVPVVRSHTRTV